MKAPIQVTPGERLSKDGKIELNAGRKKISLQVVSKCDRPIQVHALNLDFHELVVMLWGFTILCKISG